MTVVAVAVGSWVEPLWRVGGGPDVLDWMKSCVRARNEAMLAGEYWMGVGVTRMQAVRQGTLVSLSRDGIFTHDIMVGAGRAEARTAT